EWEDANAHSALYDTQKTAELFCKIFNAQSYS
ncbi:Ribonuclease T, partial [Bathymodiolus thermophilus thioautotrophic gill symbiont]